MRKLFFTLCVILIVAVVAVYIFIPGKIVFSKFVVINAKATTANRFLFDESKWNKWWPKNSAIHNQNRFQYGDYIYTLNTVLMDAGEINISNKRLSLKSLVQIFPILTDSIGIEWKSEMPATSNPFMRMKYFFAAKKLQMDMAGILGNLGAFLRSDKNVYGLDIQQIRVTDTLLISTKLYSLEYPSTQVIYNLIRKLQVHIDNEGARETNYPMLNVRKDSTTYRTMIAIPVNKTIPENNNFEIKKMVPGKILVTEVKGGEYTARQGLNLLDLYMYDNKLKSPAIPFESLITDRSREHDSTKWITKLYYPVY